MSLMRGTILEHARILLNAEQINQASFDRMSDELHRQGDVHEGTRATIEN